MRLETEAESTKGFRLFVVENRGAIGSEERLLHAGRKGGYRSWDKQVRDDCGHYTHISRVPLGFLQVRGPLVQLASPLRFFKDATSQQRC